MEASLFRLDKHLWPIGAAIVTLLAGAWLMLAPFALGYQNYGAAWAPQTVNQFWVGLGVVILSIAALALFVRQLVAALRAAEIFSAATPGQSIRPSLGQPAGQPWGQSAASDWQGRAAEPEPPPYMARPPQPMAPWTQAASAQRQPAPQSQPYPAPSQPAPYAPSWPSPSAPPEWQAQSAPAAPRPAPPPATSSSAAGSAASGASTSAARPLDPGLTYRGGWSPQSPAQPAPSSQPRQPAQSISFAPPAQSAARPESAQSVGARSTPPEPAPAGPAAPAGRAGDESVPGLPPWLQPAPASASDQSQNEFDRAMAMLAQSLARDLASRQQATAPAGESDPAQAASQVNPANPANQREVVR
jgi:hypothetical protein